MLVRKTSCQCNCVKTARSYTNTMDFFTLANGGVCTRVHTALLYLFPRSSSCSSVGHSPEKRAPDHPCKGQRVVGHRVHTASTTAASWGTPNLPSAEPTCRDDCHDIPLRTMTRAIKRPPASNKPSQFTPWPENTLEMELKKKNRACFYKNCKFLDLPPSLIIKKPKKPQNLRWLKLMLIFSVFFLLHFCLNIGLIQFFPIKQTHSLEDREPLILLYCLSQTFWRQFFLCKKNRVNGDK